MSTVLFHPGQIVPSSGVYRVRHQAHRETHQVLAIKGERFPLCRTCGREVAFEAIEAAEYVMHARDFRELVPARP